MKPLHSTATSTAKARTTYIAHAVTNSSGSVVKHHIIKPPTQRPIKPRLKSVFDFNQPAIMFEIVRNSYITLMNQRSQNFVSEHQYAILNYCIFMLCKQVSVPLKAAQTRSPWPSTVRLMKEVLETFDEKKFLIMNTEFYRLIYLAQLGKLTGNPTVEGNGHNAHIVFQNNACSSSSSSSCYDDNDDAPTNSTTAAAVNFSEEVCIDDNMPNLSVAAAPEKELLELKNVDIKIIDSIPNKEESEQEEEQEVQKCLRVSEIAYDLSSSDDEQNITFKCSVCFLQTQTKAEITKHMQMHYNKKKLV